MAFVRQRLPPPVVEPPAHRLVEPARPRIVLEHPEAGLGEAQLSQRLFRGGDQRASECAARQLRADVDRVDLALALMSRSRLGPAEANPPTVPSASATNTRALSLARILRHASIRPRLTSRPSRTSSSTMPRYANLQVSVWTRAIAAASSTCALRTMPGTYWKVNTRSLERAPVTAADGPASRRPPAGLRRRRRPDRRRSPLLPRRRRLAAHAAPERRGRGGGRRQVDRRRPPGLRMVRSAPGALARRMGGRRRSARRHARPRAVLGPRLVVGRAPRARLRPCPPRARRPRRRRCRAAGTAGIPAPASRSPAHASSGTPRPAPRARAARPLGTPAAGADVRRGLRPGLCRGP